MAEEKIMRAYKDTVFVDLFSEDTHAKENFLSLYNALFDENLTDTSALENIRLEQVLYMGLKNDVSFLVENKVIVLAEHQSTINANMPLRFLQYVAKLYEKLQDPKARYARNLIKIPTPEFFVFYNGSEDYPTNKTLRLSEAFETETKNDCTHLELVVEVLNINKTKNNKILTKCKKLDEYSLFIDAVRKHKQEDTVEAFKNAINECIEKGILKEYLQRKSREVNNMLIAEYSYETDIAVQRAEALLEGRLEGRLEGEQKGRLEGILEGEQKGRLEDAKKFKALGVDISIISQATGLSTQEIDSL